jgi:kynureninase
MDGNSLGLLSTDAEASLLRVLQSWKELGVRGWLEAEPPWFWFAERLGELAAPLVGATPDEVVATGTTTTNIHALVSTFYRPAGRRRRILADALNFPSDLYALRSQIALRGGDPERDLVLVESRDGRTLEEADLEAAMTDEVALVFLPSVLYRSGQLLDLGRLSRAARERSIPIGFDCSHSVGAVEHALSDWGVDFAVWCSYKYLNGGPGAPAFLYVSRRHFDRGPALAGWFGYAKERQFDLRLDFEPQPDARGWQISSPGILGAAPLLGSLELFGEVGIAALADKSRQLTSYLVRLADARLAEPPYGFTVGTPREPARRSGHIALERPVDAYRINLALRARGVVPDFRPPNVIRFAPVPLYTGFEDVWHLVEHIVAIVDGREHEGFDARRGAIT